MSIEKAKDHIEFHHNGADGWITLARRSGEDFEQLHYRADEINAILSEWIGEDVYFSQNTFYKPMRRVENVRQLRSIYVDVDHYLLNYSPEWVIGRMEEELFGERVPDPNLIIHSGRGFVVVWFIDPVPGKRALPLWQAVERHFARQFSDLGGDARATDAARVFRIAGSINSKNGAEVKVQYRHAYRYELRQLQTDYLPDLRPQTKQRGRPSKAARLFNAHSLHYARLRDITKLTELRNYAVKGYRETICFLYRYWSCCFLDDEGEALRQTLEFNSEFVDPLPEREVVQATRSAEKAYRARSDEEANKIARERGYPGAGYNISNEKLLKWLDITEDEQRQLETIIDKTEKRRRKAQANREARREAGAVPRSTYLAKAEERRAEARRMRQSGMSYRAIAEQLNCSVGEAHRLLN